MGLFDNIKQRYNDKVLARAQKIKAEELRAEQEAQAQIEKEQLKIEELLNTKIPKEFVMELSHSAYDQQGRYKYTLYEYFVCNVKPKDMRYGDWTQARKISGNYFGRVCNMCVHSSPFSPSLTATELYINGVRWEGDIADKLYIPPECVTIADLRQYAQVRNEQTQNRYEEDLKRKRIEEEEIRNQFFK